MAVIDPRRTETAELADVHLQVRPGTDAFLLTAMLAIMVRDGLVDQAFLERGPPAGRRSRRTSRGFRSTTTSRARTCRSPTSRRWSAISRRAVGVRAGRPRPAAEPAQHAQLVSREAAVPASPGNFGIRGGNNFHSFFLPIIGHSADGPSNEHTTATDVAAICRSLPAEHPARRDRSGRPDRVRALFVDSANPMMSGADTAAYERAFAELELLVVVDVAMTETARHAH